MRRCMSTTNLVNHIPDLQWRKVNLSSTFLPRVVVVVVVVVVVYS